ncbi:MAG: Crp/Fnr family transcriptional regulator [Elusimicrobia bacterium]|jgi:CRP-like cAMP-binding protein|nr:Crp/Fnr family transcriptional regulator [Elusimicrobiota bacterium]
MTIFSILKKVPIFNNLNDKDLKEIEKIFSRKECAKNEHIFSETDEGDKFYIVAEGRIKIYKMSSSGQIKTLDYLGEGDFFGEMALLEKNQRSAYALALEDTRLYVIKHRDFQKFLISKPKILLTISKTLCSRLRNADKEIEMFAFHKVRDRLIMCLVAQADKQKIENKNKPVEIAITHQELSELVGTAREVISRNLGNLKKEKLIEIHNSVIIIPNLLKLKNKLAD